jgi:tetratricopeptide (TPR) repeat protein
MTINKMTEITARAADNLDLKILVDERFAYLQEVLNRRDSARIVINEFKEKIQPEQVMEDTNEQKTWEAIGQFYRNGGRYFEAIEVHSSLYEYMLLGQRRTGKRAHKGMPLCWLYDCFNILNYYSISKRYLMLTLIEDAIETKNHVNADNTGSYFRLIWHRGLPEDDFNNYANLAYKIYQSDPDNGMFPEWILPQLDQGWMTEFPSLLEGNMYYASRNYLEYLITKLGDPNGIYLEKIAGYLLFCMPGARINQRQRTNSTELDIVCCIDGLQNDFRSELGHYFVCECKDYKNAKVGYPIVAKFIRVLDSTKSRFGIIVSTTGITGKGKRKDAELEIIKVFQDRGVVIIDINLDDIKLVANGFNFINMMRSKYENIRLDKIEK